MNSWTPISNNELFIKSYNYYNFGKETILWVVFFSIFTIASLTDFFDGYYARKHNLVSKEGKVLDSIADKMLTIVALVFLISFNIIFLWLALLLIMRDIVISSIRIIYAKYNKLIEAQWHGKLKTVMLFLGIIFCGFFAPYLQKSIKDEQLLILTLSSILIIALALSLYSLFLYILSIWKLKNKANNLS